MSSSTESKVNSALSRLIGEVCWYVSAGGSGGNTFGLDFGAKIPREHPLKNLAHSEEFRHFEGEATLTVWCDWRLDGPIAPVTGSDNEPDRIDTLLQVLVGQRVTAIEARPPAWDMTIAFANDLVLQVFCNHIPDKPTFDGNWDAWVRNDAIFVGPGYKVEFQEKPR